jgi:hypothetical protein
MTTPLSEHPWMEHEPTGNRAQLPDLPYWRAQGWHPCDGPPPEPDLTRDPTEAPAKPGLSAAEAEKPAAKKKETSRG